MMPEIYFLNNTSYLAKLSKNINANHVNNVMMIISVII